MVTTAEDLIAKVRVFLSSKLLERDARDRGTRDVFSQSQSWKGYTQACETWHSAYWKWVDQVAPAEFHNRLNEFQIDFTKIKPSVLESAPCRHSEKQRWIVEQSRQEALQQFALFWLAMRGPEASQPDTYRDFFEDLKLAYRIGSNAYFELLAKNKQRKPTKGSGDRQLKFRLLLTWVSGCLWALSNQGVADCLQAWYPRSQKGRYGISAISGSVRTLGLYRSAPPLYRGLSGTPPKLVSLG